MRVRNALLLIVGIRYNGTFGCRLSQEKQVAHGIMYAYVMSFVGLPYIWAGDDPIKGFDCSGLAVEILQASGSLPHKTDYTAQGLYNMYRDRSSGAAPQFLDLVFYGKDEDHVSHVGIYLEEGKIIEAAGGNSLVNSSEAAALRNAYVRIRPWYYRKDFLGFFRPHSDFRLVPSS